MITAEVLRDTLAYDPETGEFSWRASRKGVRISDPVGTVDTRGYRRIHLNRKLYWAHRLAWLYVYGEWPSTGLDHVNCVKSDNRIANLRLATKVQNGRNVGKRAHNTSGYKGVTFDASRQKWMAKIFVEKKHICLGRFANREEAAEAYKAAAERYFGEFSRY